MDGWIKLHRQLLESDTFSNEKKLKVFIYCLLKATHTEHEQVVGKQKVLLKPGQFVFGRIKASEELDMKQSTIRDYMMSLVDDKSINVESNNKYSVVTVVNWGLYQLEDEKPDNKITTNRQQNNTNKNDKNLNLLSSINKDILPEDRNSPGYKKLEELSKKILGW